jgi:hypothetical protein
MSFSAWTRVASLAWNASTGRSAATVGLLYRLLRCSRLRCLGECFRQRARLLGLVLDEVLRADDAPVLDLISSW